MKSGKQVWGTLRRRDRDTVNKSDLIALLSQSGFALEKSAPENAGQWNELVRWHAVNGDTRSELCVCMSSDRPSWKQMEIEFIRVMEGAR